MKGGDSHDEDAKPLNPLSLPVLPFNTSFHYQQKTK